MRTPEFWMLLDRCSVAKSDPTLRPHGLQHTRLLWPPLSPRVCSNSCPLSWWCHPSISFSVIPFSCLQYFPASGTPCYSSAFLEDFSCWYFVILSSAIPVIILGDFNIQLSFAYCICFIIDIHSFKLEWLPWVICFSTQLTFFLNSGYPVQCCIF